MRIAAQARFLLLFVVALSSVAAFAQTNSTLGYGDGQLLRFLYGQNFDCIDQPKTDLNFNGIPAASDPGEMQIPICEVGTQPTINPPGVAGNPKYTTEPIYVLVPMFSTDNDQNPNDAISCDNVVPGTICGSTLGPDPDQSFRSVAGRIQGHAEGVHAVS